MEEIMKKLLSIFALLFLGTVSLAQDKASFDTNKSKEEMEIMKGILKTTLNFLGTKSQPSRFAGLYVDISAVYLPGQGATFVIPASGLRVSWTAYNSSISDLSEKIALLSRENDLSLFYTPEALRKMGIASGGVGSGVGSDAAATQSPTASDKQEKDREALRIKIEDLQNRAKKRQEDEQENLRKYQQSMEEIRTYIAESLANYGDSLSTIKPDEYVNILLISDGIDNQGKKTNVISARKSWIADYKTGKLTLDAFRQKVTQYHQ
jgi:hypothetical protein